MLFVADADLLYALEFLYQDDPPNFRQHRISLKVGVPVMLLTNINRAIGLFNGISLMVMQLSE